MITTVTKNRRPFFLKDAYARQAIETLYKVQNYYLFLLFGFVIMPDHCHFLLHLSEFSSVSKMMKSYKIGVGYDIGFVGQFWQPRFHVRIPDDVSCALRYIHLNPVRAGLTENPCDYLWSSASGKWDVTSLPLSFS